MKIFELGLPILGICYGMQLMAHMLGGKVAKAQKREYGRAELIIDKKLKIFRDIPKKTVVWMSHGDRIEKFPVDFVPVAHTDNSPVAVMADKGRKILCLAISSGSGAYTARFEDNQEFSLRDMRMQAAVDDEVFYRNYY